MKKDGTTGTGTVSKVREYKIIEDDFINACYRPKHWSWRDLDINPVLVALVIVMLIATVMFILYDRQIAVIRGLQDTVGEMIAIQSETKDWVSEIQDKVIDNHIRIVELEGK